MAPPEAPGGTALTTTIDAQGQIVPLDSDDAIRSVVAAGVAEGRRRVVLEADGRVPHREVLRIAATAADVEGTMLHVGVQEP